MGVYECKYYQEDLERIIDYLPDRKINLLVTGATGLIGSCVIDTLLYANQNHGRCYTVYAIGRSGDRLKNRFSYALNNDSLHFIVQDICDSIDDNLEFNYIIHAASNADPYSYALYPVETILTNVTGTRNVLEYARKHDNTKIILTSTMEVYGALSERNSYSENDYGVIDFNHIRSGYPESKRVAELLCRSYLEEYNVMTVIARLGYIYGPTMIESDNKVVAQFIRNIIRNEDIVLKSDGVQNRSYCYVTDAVSGIFAALFRGKVGDVYNIASKNSIITIKRMAEMAAEIGNCNVIFELQDDLEKKGSSKTQDYVLDVDKLELLEWYPIYNIKTGLERTAIILK